MEKRDGGYAPYLNWYEPIEVYKSFSSKRDKLFREYVNDQGLLIVRSPVRKRLQTKICIAQYCLLLLLSKKTSICLKWEQERRKKYDKENQTRHPCAIPVYHEKPDTLEWMPQVLGLDRCTIYRHLKSLERKRLVKKRNTQYDVTSWTNYAFSTSSTYFDSKYIDEYIVLDLNLKDQLGLTFERYCIVDHFFKHLNDDKKVNLLKSAKTIGVKRQSIYNLLNYANSPLRSLNGEIVLNEFVLELFKISKEKYENVNLVQYL